MRKRKPIPLTDQLRRLMDESGLTRYEISKRTGFNESALGKFYHGQRGLSAEVLDLLGECLNLSLVMTHKPDKERKVLGGKSSQKQK